MAAGTLLCTFQCISAPVSLHGVQGVHGLGRNLRRASKAEDSQTMARVCAASSSSSRRSRPSRPPSLRTPRCPLPTFSCLMLCFALGKGEKTQTETVAGLIRLSWRRQQLHLPRNDAAKRAEAARQGCSLWRMVSSLSIASMMTQPRASCRERSMTEPTNTPHSCTSSDMQVGRDACTAKRNAPNDKLTRRLH